MPFCKFLYAVYFTYSESTNTFSYTDISVILAECPTIDKNGQSLIIPDGTFRDAPLQEWTSNKYGNFSHYHWPTFW